MVKKTSLSFILYILLLFFLFQNINAQCREVPMSVIDGSTGFTVEGIIDEEDFFGYDVKDAGDINNDGVIDIIIGAPGINVGANNDVGEAYVIFGGSGISLSSFDLTTLDGSNGFVIRGAIANGRLGNSVSSAGDINNDGVDDVMVGYPGESKTIILFGKNTSFSPLYNVIDVTGSNGIIIEGAATFNFGSYLSNLGDINNDNVDDIIIADNPFFLSSTGAIYIIYGNSAISNMNVSSINGSNGFIIEKFENTKEAKVSNAGDINNDGIKDILIGFPKYNQAPTNASGKSFVIFGSNSFPPLFDLTTINGTNGFSISSHESFTFLGDALAAANDFNNDGIDDIIIGASGSDGFNGYKGSAHLIYGKSTPFSSNLNIEDINGTNGFTILGDENYDRLGKSVDGLTDVNNDGISDIIIGATSGGLGSQGAAYIIFGGSIPTHPLQAINIWGSVGYQVFDDTERGFSYRDFGRSVSDIGDFNEDGYSDFIIGSSGISFGEKGKAYVFYSETYIHTDSERPSIICPGDQQLQPNSLLPNYEFLMDVSDNCSQHWELSFSQSPVAGTPFTGDTSVEITVTDNSGNSNSCNFIVRVVTEKIDIDCSAEAFSVKNIDQDDGIILYGEKPMGRAGYSVDHLGDVNGDGIDDFIVGAEGENHFATGPYSLDIFTMGTAYIVFGTDSGFPSSIALGALNGSNGFIIRNDISEFRQAQGTGSAVSSAGDINRDGIDDIMVSEPGRIDVSGQYLGEVYIIYGTRAGFPTVLDCSNINGINGFTIRGVHSSGFLGMDIDNIGDINNDGADDIAIITGGYGADPGKCYVVYGTSSGFPALLTVDQLNGSNGFVIQGGADSANYISTYLAGLGDVNGDGIDDLAVSNRNSNGNKYVIYGNSGFPAILTVTDLNGTNGFAINHSTLNIDRTVRKAGDINNDGLNDIVIGNQYILFGNSSMGASVDVSTLDGSNGFLLTSENGIKHTKWAGDFNNDGIDDLVCVKSSDDFDGRVGRGYRAQIIYGKESWEGVISTTDFTFQDALSINLDLYGLNYSSLSAGYAGDVNNDGIDDVIIGAANRIDFGYNILNQPGFAYVIFGKEITDDESPTFTCLDDQVLETGNTLPDYTLLIDDLEDNCDTNPVLAQTPVAGSTYTLGMTVQITAEDVSGNVSLVCEFIVNETADTTNPTLTCIGDQELACDIIEIPDYTSMVTANDNIDTNPTITQTPVAGSPFTIGMTITLIATDGSGNESDPCTFSIIEASDRESPTFSCLPDQVLVSGSILPDYTLLIDDLDDNCDTNPVLTQTPAAGSTYTPGMTVQITAEDVSGNVSIACEFIVNETVDTTNPTITCIGDQQLACGTTTIPDYTGMVTANDDTDTNPTITQTPVVGSTFTIGMTITLIATDGSGNESDPCTFNIIEATDTEAPTFSCLADQQLASGSILPDYTLLIDDLEDNCDTNPVLAQTPVAGSTYIPGMTVQITAEDVSGNVSLVCEFIVNETADTTNPTLTCIGDQELACGTTTIPDYTGMVTANDDTDTNPTITQTPVAGSTFISGMTIVLTATDISGNQSIPCSFVLFEEILEEIDAGNDVSIQNTEEIELNATINLNGNFEWSPEEGLDNPYIANPIASPNKTITYTVTFTTENGCVTTDEITVTVNELSEDETKYGFSPDGDGINEFWEIKGIENYPNNKVMIYNRWGDMVFEIKGYDNQSNIFTGEANRIRTFGGGELPEGTYFFRIDIVGEHHFKKTEGFLVLKR